MDQQAFMPQMPPGYGGVPGNFSRSPYLSQPAYPQYNSGGPFIGSAVSQNISFVPLQQNFLNNYLGSQVMYQNPPSFMFKERKGAVNWRNIANIDVDELIAKGDIKTLEALLSNITYANLEKDDLDRLSQYGLEYLLNCQNYLANQSQALDFQYRMSEEQLKPLEDQARKNQAEIVQLKNDVKDKKKIIKTYHNTLNNPLLKCHLCAKYFKSQEFLDAHFQNRHPNYLRSKEPVKTPKQEEPIKKAESAVQTFNEQQQQLEQSKMIEKLIDQLKHNEDMRLSQLTSALQQRLQEIVQSNQALTAKVSEIEKKMETSLSPAKPHDESLSRTLKQDHRTEPEHLRDLHERSTPRKNKPEDSQVIHPEYEYQIVKRSYRAGDLEDIKQVPKIRQVFKAGELEDDYQSELDIKKREYRASSLKDLEDDHDHDQGLIIKKQMYRAGDLMDTEPNETDYVPRHRERHEIGKKQTYKAGNLEDDVKETKKTLPFHAGELENDDESFATRGRKKSQEDFVVMEEEEEHYHAHYANLKHLDEDQIRELHRSSINKASQLIRNKYKHPITPEQIEDANQEIEDDLNRKCKDQLKFDYSRLPDQKMEDLERAKDFLQKANRKDVSRRFDVMKEEYIDSAKEYEQNVKKLLTNQRYRKDSHEVGGTPKHDGTPQFKNNKMMQSSDLDSLLVIPEKQERGRSVNTPTNPRKQIFESQNLHLPLSSVDDLKKSGGQMSKSVPPGKDVGTNLMKKSFQNIKHEHL